MLAIDGLKMKLQELLGKNVSVILGNGKSANPVIEKLRKHILVMELRYLLTLYGISQENYWKGLERQ